MTLASIHHTQQPVEDTLTADFKLGQNKIKGISPNMMVQQTKTEKEV
jgi:hypothetical protein